MRVGGWTAVLVGALLLTAVPGMAETVNEEVADRTVTVHVLEEDSMHSFSESETSSFMYHEESRTFGAWVDDEGANATLTNFTRENTYDDGTYESEQTTEGVQLELDGNAAGFDIDYLVQAYLIDLAYDFGEDNNGEATHVTVNYWGNTWGNGMQARNSMTSGTGAGDIVGPTMGDIVYASSGFYSRNNLRVDDVSLGANGGPSGDLFAGDWNGALVSFSISERHCQDFECQGTGAGEAVCLIGYRPPFFFDCLA